MIQADPNLINILKSDQNVYFLKKKIVSIDRKEVEAGLQATKAMVALYSFLAIAIRDLFIRAEQKLLLRERFLFIIIIIVIIIITIQLLLFFTFIFLLLFYFSTLY